MGTISVFLLDVGPAQELPGFDSDFSFCLLPFWGNHCLADFLVAAFSADPRPEVTILVEEERRNAAAVLSSRWKKPLARVEVLDDGLAGVARRVAESEAEYVAIGSTACLYLTDPGLLRDRICACGQQVVKLSISRTPIELYAARREHMAGLLAAEIPRSLAGSGLRRGLLEGILHDSLELIVDLPGEILFQNDLMEYYTHNIWVVANSESPRFHSTLARMPELADKGAESHVAERGSVRDSWLASSVEVEGVVEESILFPHVVVRRHAHVFRSVVLNGNRIGSATEIQRTLVLPFTAEIARPFPNIGERCSIGARTSGVKNADFPSQIRDGISVIGTNVDVPNGFRAEAASYIAPGVTLSTLRKLKVLKKGASVLRQAPVRPDGNGSGELA